VRQTAKILGKLLADGELGGADGALIAEYRAPEVRSELDILGEEMGFTLVEMRGKVYLVPQTDSELLTYTMRDIRESDSRSDRMIDAFLQCYITMTILWLLYGGKNSNPKRVIFLQIKGVIEALDQRFSDIGALEAQRLELEYEINFPQIASHWSALPVYDAQRRKTRAGAVLRACRLLEREKLLIILDEGREIRPTERLDDLMIGHYLDMRRIEEIHALFDRIPMMEVNDAEAEQD
jgi:hypothetical protein